MAHAGSRIEDERPPTLRQKGQFWGPWASRLHLAGKFPSQEDYQGTVRNTSDLDTKSCRPLSSVVECARELWRVAGKLELGPTRADWLERK